MKSIIISGTSSHCGKTTIACGILSALRHCGLNVCTYKTGPDYIDPQYLRLAGQCEAYNLDTWLMTPERTRELFAETSRGHDIAIIEGAMGLYDGGNNSTAEIAKLLRAPVILVVDVKSIGESAAAIALGFREYDSNVNVAGVILNRVASDYHEKIIADSLSANGIKLLGVIRRNDCLAVPERHLGLVPAVENMSYDTDRLGQVIGECVNLREVLNVAESEAVCVNGDVITPCVDGVTVGIARDEAFSFYYPESLRTLEELGAKLVYFSPMRDEYLPEADGYIFGGGFPEMFARELSGNVSMLESVRQCRKHILAECGGFMYLCRSITDINGNTYGMAGMIPYNSRMTSRPVMGYMEARALRDNILCCEGETLRGHEFHYSAITGEQDKDTRLFELTRRNTNTSHYGGYVKDNITASYLHINFFGNINSAKHLLSLIDIN